MLKEFIHLNRKHLHRQGKLYLHIYHLLVASLSDVDPLQDSGQEVLRATVVDAVLHGALHATVVDAVLHAIVADAVLHGVLHATVADAVHLDAVHLDAVPL